MLKIGNSYEDGEEFRGYDRIKNGKFWRLDLCRVEGESGMKDNIYFFG